MMQYFASIFFWFQGIHLNVASLASRPYVTEMIDIGNDTYRFDGMFAEVFHSLQVIAIEFNL